jgi:hypothetical protein
VLHLVTIHADLVAADDCLQAVLLAKLPGNVRPELHTNASLTGSPAFLLLGICPQHFHHEACLAGLSLIMSVQLSDIVEGDVVVGKETTVKDKVFPADKCS